MLPSIRLTNEQVESIKRAVFADISSRTKMEPILNGLEKARYYAEFVTETSTYPETLSRIIKESAAEGWLVEWIEKILAVADDDELKSIRAGLTRAHAAGPDPFFACRLSGSNILIDRSDLRSHARSLVDFHGKRMLVVKGSRRSGKTHTGQFLAYLQQMRGGFTIRRIDLSSFNRIPGVPIRAATTNSPIQITTSKPHGFTSGNQVFIDGVMGLAGANGLFALTVTGPCEFTLQGSAGSGTYTGGGSVKLQTPLEASQIAEALLDLLPYPDVKIPDPPTDGQWARWVLQFCNRLESAVLAAPPPDQIWIIIDTFHVVSLAQSANDLIRELANRINFNLFSLRLVLLGFEESMPADITNHLAEETIGRIGEDQIIEAIGAAFAQMQLQQNVDKIADVVEAIFREADLNDPDFLFKIGSVTTRELQKLETGQ
jgi:hypothetical protein